MKNTGLTNVTFQQINAFLVVAKYLNMTRAAEAAFVTQSLLSQKISSLEYELNLKLFTRTKRRLQLTPEGKYLYERWSALINDMEQDINTARHIRQTASKSIHITFCFGISSKISIHIMQSLEKTFPDLQFSCQLSEIFQMPEQLLEHDTDLAIAPNYDLDYYSGMIQHITIKESNIKAFVGKNHILAKKDHLEWSDLKDCCILCQPASQSGGYEKRIRSICQKYGFVPKLVPCNNIFTTSTRMALGEGILVGVLSPVQDLAEDCVCFELPDSKIPIVMSCASDKRNDPEFNDFIERSIPVFADYLV